METMPRRQAIKLIGIGVGMPLGHGKAWTAARPDAAPSRSPQRAEGARSTLWVPAWRPSSPSTFLA
jgi:hypothetical protein